MDTGMPARSRGKLGEMRAAQHLEGLGWRILERNVQTSGGEIDLIALDGEILAFVEVKVRNGGAIHARESVTLAKQRRICRTALWYMQRHGLRRQARFDVIEIQDGALTLIKNAFPYRGGAF